MKQDTIKKCEITPRANLSNLIIKPERGKAIFWYNHALSPKTGWMSQLDPMSFVGGGNVTKGERWTAKMWVDIIGDGVEELRPWKMGNNWLSGNNKKQKLVEKMRNDFFVEGSNYVHFHRPTYHQSAKVTDKPAKVKPKPPKKMKVNTFSPAVSVEVSKDDGNTKIIPPEPAIQTSTTNNEAKFDLPLNQGPEKASKPKGRDENPNKNTKAVLAETLSSTSAETLSVLDSLKKTSAEPTNAKVEQKTPPQDKPVKPDTQASNIPSETVEFVPKRQDLPLGPPRRPVQGYNPFPEGMPKENRLVKAALLLMEELERDELETVARTLHDKLQLACIPLIVNPIRGP